jgi:predicted ATP-dependent endonuclease of OLD family
MRIDFVEIANFRKLRSIRIELSKKETLFVGANNSGKTSAMVALRYFLLERERSKFSSNLDNPLALHPTSPLPNTAPSSICCAASALSSARYCKNKNPSR